MTGFDFVNGMYEVFATEVEANTNLEVDLVYAGALGAPNARLNQMRRGVIQMSDASAENFATVYNDIQVFGIPYLFASEETAWEVLDGELGQEIAENMRRRTGLRVLGWWESGGFRHYSANRPIRKPADMSGLKIRVLGPLAQIPVEALGASAVNVDFGELYTSLRTGVVDGQDNSVAAFNLVKLYEVQRYLTLTGHTYAFAPLCINEDYFQSLSENEQLAIIEAADKAIDFNRSASREIEAQAIDFARRHGVEVIELDEATRHAFQRLAQPPAIAWLRRKIDSPELVDRALATARASARPTNRD